MNTFFDVLMATLIAFGLLGILTAAAMRVEDKMRERKIRATSRKWGDGRWGL